MKIDWWKKGQVVDLWSVPHFLFGILMAFFPILIGFSIWASLVLTLLFAMLWEIYEKFIDIKETIPNSLIDILLPVLAFILTSLTIQKIELQKEDALVVATAIFVVYCFTNISGWLAYRRRQREFMN
jgi:multidrug transporter EmrE-like cation transporter